MRRTDDHRSFKVRRTCFACLERVVSMAGVIVVIVNRRFARLAALLLGVLVLIFALTIHLPGSMNPAMMLTAVPLLLRDVALSGGAFAFAGILKE